MHVRLGALDMIMQVISEELDMTDGSGGDEGIGEVTGEEDKCDIADVLRSVQARYMPNL
jgi:hypothetical protein